MFFMKANMITQLETQPLKLFCYQLNMHKIHPIHFGCPNARPWWKVLKITIANQGSSINKSNSFETKKLACPKE